VDDKKTTAEPINDSSMLWKYEKKKKKKRLVSYAIKLVE